MGALSAYWYLTLKPIPILGFMKDSTYEPSQASAAPVQITTAVEVTNRGLRNFAIELESV